jgi:hypothetical protein
MILFSYSNEDTKDEEAPVQRTTTTKPPAKKTKNLELLFD